MKNLEPKPKKDMSDTLKTNFLFIELDLIAIKFVNNGTSIWKVTSH